MNEDKINSTSGTDTEHKMYYRNNNHFIFHINAVSVVIHRDTWEVIGGSE